MEKADTALLFGLIFAFSLGILVGLITAATIDTIGGFENTKSIAFLIGTIVCIITWPLWTIAWIVRQQLE